MKRALVFEKSDGGFLTTVFEDNRKIDQIEHKTQDESVKWLEKEHIDIQSLRVEHQH